MMVYTLPLFVLLFSFLVSEHFPPWTAYHTEVPAFASVVLALVLCWRAASRRVPLAGVALPVGLLVLSALLQLALGQLSYAGDAWVVVAYLLAFLAAAWWGQQWAEKTRPQQLVFALAVFLLLAGMLVEFQMLAQWLQVEARFGGWVIDKPPHGRPYGNLGQPNQAATLLVMASVALILLQELGKVRRCVAWPALLFLAWGIVLTQSRTALLSSFLLSLGLLATAPAHWSRAKVSIVIWLAGIMVGTGLLQIVPWGDTSSTTTSLTSVGLRPLMWRQLLTALVESPWIGWGWLQIASAQQAGALLVPGVEQTNYAHNAILDLLLVVGIPAGGAFLLWLLLTCWRYATRILAHEGALSLAYVLVPFLVHSMLEFPHAYAYYLVLVGVILGAIEQWTRAPSDRRIVMPRVALAVLAVSLTVLYLSLAMEYAGVEEDFRVNRFENRRLGSTPVDYRPPKARLLTQYGELLAAMRLRAVPDMQPEDLALLQRVSQRFSWAPLYFRTALALGLNGQAELAQAQLNKIKAMYTAEIYDDARDNWLRMQREQYPQLARIALP